MLVDLYLVLLETLVSFSHERICKIQIGSAFGNFQKYDEHVAVELQRRKGEYGNERAKSILGGKLSPQDTIPPPPPFRHPPGPCHPPPPPQISLPPSFFQKNPTTTETSSSPEWATPPVRPGLSGRNSGKIPERPRKRSQSVSGNSPREYGWDPPSPIIQGI